MKLAVLAGSRSELDRFKLEWISDDDPNVYVYVQEVSDLEGHIFDGILRLRGWRGPTRQPEFYRMLSAHTRVAGRIKGGLL